MSATKVQRGDHDGPISVNRFGEVIQISVDQNGTTTHCVMSEWNARRVLGCLSVILELPLTPKAAKSIQLGTVNDGTPAQRKLKKKGVGQ